MKNKNPKAYKICFIMPQSYLLFIKSNQPTGGAEINLYFLAKEFSKLNNLLVNFIVSDYAQKRVEFIDKIKLIKLKYRRPRINSNENKLYERILKWIILYYTLLINNSDVFIVSTSSGVLFETVLLCKILKRKKVIYRIAHDRDCNGEYAENNGLKGKLYRFGLHRADKIIAQNSDQVALLKKAEGLNAEIIRNGFPLETDKTDNERNIILWVGRCVDWKRPMLFLDLAKKLPEFNFIMIARRVDTARYILDTIEKIDNIRLIEEVSFFKIHEYFQRARCFVNTSTAEGFPNTFIQSCIAGTPILTYTVNPENILDEYNLGLCCNDDQERAANFIRSLDKQMLELYNQNCKKYVHENHDISEKADQYLNVIYKLIK